VLSRRVECGGVGEAQSCQALGGERDARQTKDKVREVRPDSGAFVAYRERCVGRGLTRSVEGPACHDEEYGTIDRDFLDSRASSTHATPDPRRPGCTMSIACLALCVKVGEEGVTVVW